MSSSADAFAPTPSGAVETPLPDIAALTAAALSASFIATQPSPPPHLPIEFPLGSRTEWPLFLLEEIKKGSRSSRAEAPMDFLGWRCHPGGGLAPLGSPRDLLARGTSALKSEAIAAVPIDLSDGYLPSASRCAQCLDKRTKECPISAARPLAGPEGLGYMPRSCPEGPRCGSPEGHRHVPSPTLAPRATPPACSGGLPSPAYFVQLDGGQCRLLHDHPRLLGLEGAADLRCESVAQLASFHLQMVLVGSVPWLSQPGERRAHCILDQSDRRDSPSPCSS